MLFFPLFPLAPLLYTGLAETIGINETQARMVTWEMGTCLSDHGWGTNRPREGSAGWRCWPQHAPHLWAYVGQI